MQIGNVFFPYPTINNNLNRNCFNKTSYEFCCNDYSDEEYYYLDDAHININNDTIRKMINNGELGIGLVIECSSTIYRKMFEISLEPKSIKIPISELRDKVEVSCFVYAKKDIEGYMDDDFLEDYQGYSFNLLKNDILAIDDGYTITIDYDDTMDKKVSSIFQVIRKKELDHMQIDKTPKKIIISLPDQEYGYYDNLKNKYDYQNMFFAILAIPALSNALKEIQVNLENGMTDMDAVEIDYIWFASVKGAYKKQFGKDLTEEEFRNVDVVQLSQKLLNNGCLNGIDDLFNIAIGGQLKEEVKEEGEDYE